MYDLISLIITADSFRLQLSFYFIFYIFLKHFFLFSRNMPIPSDPHSFALTVKMHNWFNGFIFYFECLSKCRQMCFSARDFQSKKKKSCSYFPLLTHFGMSCVGIFFWSQRWLFYWERLRHVFQCEMSVLGTRTDIIPNEGVRAKLSAALLSVFITSFCACVWERIFQYYRECFFGSADLVPSNRK